jgi:hypothetical protein
MAFRIEDWIEDIFLPVQTQATNQSYVDTSRLHRIPSQPSGTVHPQAFYQSEVGRPLLDPTLSLIPPLGQWQHIPLGTTPESMILAYRDSRSGVVLCAPYAGYNPGPYVFDLAVYGLGVGPYTMCGPHYNTDGWLTYQQQFDLDAATGGRIWGGYENYHGFEILEHVQTRLRDEAAKAAAEAEAKAIAEAAALDNDVRGADHGEAAPIRGACGLAERMLEYRNTSTLGLRGDQGPSKRGVEGTKEHRVEQPAGDHRNSLDLATSTTETSTLSMNIAGEQECLDATAPLALLRRFAKSRSSTFSFCPGPYTRLPPGLVLTTIEVLT